MVIGKKNGSIVAFNDTLAQPEINSKIKRISLDPIEETDEQIVPSHTTSVDGIYYKASEVPPVPVEIANERVRILRQQLYIQLSDPIINHMEVIQHRLDTNDYADDAGKDSLETRLTQLGNERKAVRQQTANDNPYIQ
jgi:hypothetical protein